MLNNTSFFYLTADTEVSLPTDEASSSTSDQTRPKIWVSKSLTEIPVKKHDKSGPEISVDTLSKVSSSAPLKAMSEVPAQTRAPLTTPVRNIAPTPIAKTTTSTLGSTLLQMPASTSTSTPVITPTAILVRTPIAPPVKTFMAIPVTALVITPVVATAIAGTNASSNTLEEVSTPTCVAQADQVAPQQNLGSAPTNEKDSQENDLVRKNEASSTWEKKSEQPPVLVTTELQPALYCECHCYQ
ncbi:hypothetical protein FHG87_020003 [Trinorchestia longiramus]|nr:hypothetical protein FHG87_020003 [Trinorchestia longiramus]